MHSSIYRKILRSALALFCIAGMPFLLRAQDTPTSQPSASDSSDSQVDATAIPTMFPHLKIDRLWISGQANFISQYHPEFHSPYSGSNSLPAEAQDASSRVITLFTGLRLTQNAELLCDIQETGG